MNGSLVQAADFRRLLATPPSGRSAHFALHYLHAVPTRPQAASRASASKNLSTDEELVIPRLVDESPAARWLGCLVPKRLARRSVTRNCLKRQIRASMSRHASALPLGLWLVRLRAPFPVTQYPAADSPALRVAARAELDRLFGRAAAGAVTERAS